MDNRTTTFSPRIAVLAGLIVACALSRLLPHPFNFSPIEAMALFAGAYFADRRLALLVPIAAMVLSDLILGFYWGAPVTYVCMALIALVASYGLRNRVSALRVAAFGLGGAVFFFIVTNFVVWLGLDHPMYPRTFAGLVQCYVAAIPFFKNQLAGVLVYSAVLFGGFALMQRQVPSLARAA
jgi:hypothetical protein